MLTPIKQVRFTYLASPYTHDDADVRHERYVCACRAAAYLMARGEVIFSPIAHSHPIEQQGGRMESGEFWRRQDEPYLEFCSKLYVLLLAGWDRSAGVAHEIRRAIERGIPVEFIEP